VELRPGFHRLGICKAVARVMCQQICAIEHQAHDHEDQAAVMSFR
jgi:hypothetical protein